MTTCIDEKLIFCYCFMLRLVLSRVPVVVVVVGDVDGGVSGDAVEEVNVVVEEGFVVVGVVDIVVVGVGDDGDHDDVEVGVVVEEVDGV